MQFTNIASKATFKLKDGAGKVRGISVVAPGTSWTLQVIDGNDAGTPGSGYIIGATAMTVPAAATFINLGDVGFSKGLIVVSGGTTAGEVVIFWE